MNIPNARLKATFFVHFILAVWALQANWLPASYTFYNFIFMVLLLWCLQQLESEEPVFMALSVNAISIVLDCITFGIYYEQGYNNHSRVSNLSNFRFSAGMGIMNLLIRLLTCLILLRIYNERCGNRFGFGFPGLGGQAQSPYEDIDRPTSQIVPQNSMDTGSPDHHSPLPKSPISQPHFR